MLTPFNEVALAVHENAKDKGWWDDDRPFAEIISLIHTEVSEAFEEYRNGHKPTEIYYRHKNGETVTTILPGWEERGIVKPEGIPIELADVIIRILDFCGKTGIDIDEAIRIKMAYNKTRPHRHGGKLA